MKEEPAEVLVEIYAAAAFLHGQGTSPGGDADVANRAATEITAVYSELKRRGPEAQRALLPLLSSDDPNVRLWAAAHALEFAPSEGEPVLTALAKTSGFTAFSAKMALKQWREGTLQFR